MAESVRRCGECGEERDLSEFVPAARLPGGFFVCFRCSPPRAVKPARAARAATSPASARSAAGSRWEDLRPKEDVRSVIARASSPAAVVINTYAGSLLLGCKAAGVEVAASLEDSAYGTQLQHANFPELRDRMAGSHRHWPDVSLAGAVAVAHPPCAAFSIQAKGSRLKSGTGFGLDSEHFQETLRVINYCLSRDVEALAVESVQGTMEGAREAHDAVAARYGYGVFRVLQNAATFGVPQWRPRFWALFSRRKSLRVWHSPECVTLEDAVGAGRVDPGEPDPVMEERFRRQLDALRSRGYDPDRVLAIPGKMVGTVRRLYEPELDIKDIAKAVAIGANARPEKVGYSFVSKTMQVLHPLKPTPLIIGDCWWVHGGRTLTQNQYKAIMGFPVEYDLGKNQHSSYTTWLSKGVVPAVAAWVVSLLVSSVTGREPDGAFDLEAGDVADFQPTRDEWAKASGGMA